MSERNEEQDPEGAIPLWQRLWRKKRGDVIQGTVGEGARNVVVGKNIVQIGTLIIPILPLLVVSLALLGIFVLGIYRFLLPPPPAPKAMTGIFNVAVVDFSEVNAAGVAHPSMDGQLLANLLFKELLPRFNKESADVELDHEPAYILGDPEARRKAVAKLASQINADIVIYGYFDSSRQPNQFVPKFYVSPRLSGAEESTESTGDNTFGEPMAVKLPLAENSPNRAALTKEVLPRFEALTEFMFGLAYFKADNPDEALKHLERARDVPGWEEKQGKEILYLWIGSTLNKRALLGGEKEDFSCPVTSGEQSDYRDCARAAYETALKLNPDFARAYIGLGKLWFDRAEQTRDGRTFFECGVYDRAIEEYQQALDPTMEVSETAYVDLKVYFNTGLAYASQYRNCGDEYLSSYSLAVKNLELAIAAYEKSPKESLLHELGAKAYYQLGLVYSQATHYEVAVNTFRQVITIAEPDQKYEEGWQSIRWIAYKVTGDAYSELAQNGERTNWQNAIEAYKKVMAAYEEGKYSDNLVASEAYYRAGVAYEALGDMVQARVAYTQARDQGIPDSTIVALAEEKLQALGEP